MTFAMIKLFIFLLCGQNIVMTSFQGKRFLVTGGSDGIGRGIVAELWKLGAKVVALSNQHDKLLEMKSLYDGIDVVFVDLNDWYKSRKVIKSLDPFDGLVNCAGIIINEPFLEIKEDHFEKTISVNVRGMLNVSQVVARNMIEHEIKGSIINISSQASKVGFHEHGSYCSSKGAVDAMSRVMALELGKHGIRVNTINPTVVMTDLGRLAWADPHKANVMLNKIPLGRFGEVPDIVNAALFLLSDKSSMITGVNLPVDGGFLAT